MTDKAAAVQSGGSHRDDSASDAVIQQTSARPYGPGVTAFFTVCLLCGIAALDRLLLKWRSHSQPRSPKREQRPAKNILDPRNSNVSKSDDSPAEPDPQKLSTAHDQVAKSLEDTLAHVSWTEPRHQNIPRPTYSPAVMALAIVCLLWGIVTTYLISLLGVVLFGIALAGWIGELHHEHQPG
ncbi:MAG: hypothetical protein WB630_18595 [Candidatus Acidiferrales bacterium]